MQPVICYLCGKTVEPGMQSADHVVPKQLLEGHPPKSQGFLYGGTLPTHRKCNNEFGPETYGQRSLELIEALHNPKCTIVTRHSNDPKIKLMAINSACLPNFGKRELLYFKMLDRRGHAENSIPEVDALRGANPVDPFKDSLFTGLAVLLKSAAAIAISRKIGAVPPSWQVMAVPYVGDADSFDFDDIFGKTKPSSPQVKIWSGTLVTDDVFVVYRATSVLVYFFFRLSKTMEGWRHMRSQFIGKPRLRFDGACINEVLVRGWKQV